MVEEPLGRKLREQLDRDWRDAQREFEKHERQIEVNAQLVHGAHKTVFKPGKNRYFTANLINNVVVTQTAVMTEKEIRPVFVPRETNEPPEIFLKPEAAIRVPKEAGFSREQLMGIEVLDDGAFDYLMSQTEPAEVDNPRAGEQVGTGDNARVQPDKIKTEVPVFSQEDFILLDDALCAEALTQEHNSEWEMSGCQERVRKYIFEAVARGWKDFIIQWNEQESRFEYVDLYPFNCRIDRWATGITDAEYFIVRHVMPVSEAMREYPDAAAEIQKSKSINTTHGDHDGYRGGKYDSNTEREIVEVYTEWRRNHPFPMDPADAIERGLIEPAVAEPLMDPETGAITGMGGPILDESGGQQFILSSDGSATTPGLDNWPVRYGVYQYTLIGDYVVDAGEADASDFPVARILNIPLVDSPYGTGEPQRLAEIQDLINRLFSIFHDYCLFYRSPERAVPDSVMDQLEDVFKTMHSSAGHTYGVPDDLWQAFNGKIIETVPVPVLADTFFRIIDLLLGQLNSISGMTDVLRGEAKSEWSGELFAQATNAARGPIGYKARHVGDAIKHAAKISAGYIIDFLPLDEWAKRNKKYPPQILESMRRRLKRIGYDVSVEIGGASSRDSEAAKLSVVLQNNPELKFSPTFMKQVMDLLGIKEGEKIVGEMQQGMMLQQQPQPA